MISTTYPNKAEREGFEPSRLLHLHDFQSCALDRTMRPLQDKQLHFYCTAGRVGFEPTVDRSPQRFSRPPQSSTLAPPQVRSTIRECSLFRATEIIARAEKCGKSYKSRLTNGYIRNLTTFLGTITNHCILTVVSSQWSVVWFIVFPVARSWWTIF